MSICCISHVGSGSNWLCEDSGGEDVPCLSCAMSFYSVSFMNEGIEECVEGILASGHERGYPP